MNRLASIALALALVPAVCGAQDTYGVNPGYWEIRTNWLGVIIRTERYCVAPERIAKILGGPCNHNYRCNYPTQQVADGKAFFEGDIIGRDEAYHVKGGGAYTATSMDMRMTGAGHWHFVPINGAYASVRARFLSADCPADAKKL
jgi:hypothetical protein